ncbi:MAG: metallophosphoesterase [Methanosphaera stadtmanae]|nr:metallophosphoesterase [Methanosphaera stadtmanae]
MLIGVISDTHIPYRATNIPKKVFEEFKDVDLILHAGDIEELTVLDELKKIAPVKAVNGNCDYHPELNDFEVIKIENIKIGLTHGTVYPKGDTQQLYYLAKELGVDVLISGHTHRYLIKQVNDVLLLNPGSPTQPRSTEASIMLIKIENSNLEAKIIKI